LIFDENSQRCTWALPWQRCNGNEENTVEFKKHSFFSPINKEILEAKITTKIPTLSTFSLQKISNITSQSLSLIKNDVEYDNLTDEMVLKNLKNKLMQMQQRQAGASLLKKPSISPFVIDHQSNLFNFISSSIAAKTSLASTTKTTTLATTTPTTKKTIIKSSKTTKIIKPTQKVTQSLNKKSSILTNNNITNNKYKFEKNNFSRLFLNNLNIESDALYEDFNVTDINEKFLLGGKLNKLDDKDDEDRDLNEHEYSEENEENDDNDDDDDEEEEEQEDESDDQSFAYIIVPIKLNKNTQHKKTKYNMIDYKKNRNKNKKAKNFEEMYKYKKVCYITNWSQYREKPAQFLPEHVDPFLCTHLIYAFAYIDNVTFKIKTIEENDEGKLFSL
jgi:hypothetical protein